MNLSNEEAIKRYIQVRDELREKSPEMWQFVIELCAAVPDKIKADTIWKLGRDKPCWSNIRVNIGERIARDIESSEDFNSHAVIASDAWKIVMKARGPRWKSNENFLLEGESARSFIEQLKRGGLSSYLWKLYAIRNLAIALNQNTTIQKMINKLTFDGSIPPEGLRIWTKEFSREVGVGWGVITVYHMLTDCGLTPKPDLHLKRSAIRMGLLKPTIPENYPENFFNSVSDHDVVLSVMHLSELISPTAYPINQRSALREVDKVLMEWSRQGLLRPMGV